jgi:hypothetical protein
MGFLTWGKRLDDRAFRRWGRSDDSKYSPQSGAGLGMVCGSLVPLVLAVVQLVQRREAPVFLLILGLGGLAFGAWNMRAGRRR